MGKSPAEQFQSQAKGAVDKAIASQVQLTKDLNKQRTEFLGGGAPQNYAEASEELRYITGQDPAQWISNVEGRFYPAIQQMTEAARGQLRDFKPGLIGSKSTRDVTNYLTAVSEDFQKGIEGQSERAGARLRSLPQMATDYFTASSKNPAFENMINQQAMTMAENPKTVSQDSNFISNARRWMTYNV